MRHKPKSFKRIVGPLVDDKSHNVTLTLTKPPITLLEKKEKHKMFIKNYGAMMIIVYKELRNNDAN